MHEAKAIVSAPRSTSFRARNTAFLPGQPPQLQNPTSVMSPSTPSKAPLFSRTVLKSLVPGQKSSVCIQRIIPNFISVTSVKARFLHAPQNIGFRVSYSCGSLRRYTTVSRPVFPISFFPFPCKRMLNYYIKSPWIPVGEELMGFYTFTRLLHDPALTNILFRPVFQLSFARIGGKAFPFFQVRSRTGRCQTFIRTAHAAAAGRGKGYDCLAL